ncbi:MAG: 7-cyano-7-deazaguanine synthase [Promethearchaeota archaeon]
MKFVSLLSGGLDSPVATYIMMKKGFDCIAINFNPTIDPQNLNKKKIIQIAEKLKELTKKNITVYFINNRDILTIFKNSMKRKLTCILCKRFMLRIAETLAIRENAFFIVNGDILGEQASQTLDNLVQIQKVITEIPVIRPLIGYEKLEVIKLSQKLGLYPLSILQAPPCDFNPKYPETHAKSSEIEQTEQNIDFKAWIKAILESAEKIEI